MRLFSYNNTDYNLRTKEFVIPRVNTTGFGKHSVRYMGPLLWSKLDAKVREEQSVDAFKKLIRKQNLTVLISTNNCDNCVLRNS